MWLITTIGFFSIVEKPTDREAGTLTVRARARKDLESLKSTALPSMGDISEGLGTDYRFRATATRKEIAAAIAAITESINYTNFKDEIAKTQGDNRADLYHDVWKVLDRLQTDPVFADPVSAADSFGGVVVSGGGRVLLREPSKHHGGYTWTFAKTKADKGESPRDAAVRAVREKTGYEARICLSMPGVFSGASSESNFFLMDAKHPPGKPSWQTERTRWATFGEARDLIRQSHSVEGRDRDLAILASAEKALVAIPYKTYPNVQPEDWQGLRIMPAHHEVLHLNARYDVQAMTNIRRGFYPTVMEQKWFAYLTGTRLRLHRSWTGILIFDVGFSFDESGGAQITEVVVNRERREYQNTNVREELELLKQIIENILIDRLEEPTVDGMVAAFMLATQPGYLGSPDVVATLVKPLFDVVLRKAANEATDRDIAAVNLRITAALTEDSTDYTRMQGWHSAEQLGKALNKYIRLDSNSAPCEDFGRIVSASLTSLSEKVETMIQEFVKDPNASWEPHATEQFAELHQFVVSVLLGTNALSYPDKTLHHFKWSRVSAAVDTETVETIVKVGFEGGNVSLVGIQTDGAWKYHVQGSESTMNELFNSDGQAEAGVVHWVVTWRSAVKQLDKYPWTKGYPLFVLPEFRKKMVAALKVRLTSDDVSIWGGWNEALRAGD